MATKTARVFSLTMAILFLLSTLAFTGVVVWQIIQDGQTDGSGATQQQTQQQATEDRMLEDFEPVDNVEELQKIDRKEGDGEVVKKGATVVAHYTGALAKDGKVFQSSRDFGQAIEFPLDGVIEGWTEGVPGMKAGGIRRLVIPYEQAYGKDGRPDGGIPPKADLVFDIEIVEVQNP